ncbi:hypothetical protein D3C77_383330 [compost metagenome]
MPEIAHLQRRNVVCADTGYIDVEKRPEHEGRALIWQIAVRSSTYKHLGKCSTLYKAKRKIEQATAQVRVKVEPPFRVIKRKDSSKGVSI